MGNLVKVRVFPPVWQEDSKPRPSRHKQMRASRQATHPHSRGLPTVESGNLTPTPSPQIGGSTTGYRMWETSGCKNLTNLCRRPICLGPSVNDCQNVGYIIRPWRPVTGLWHRSNICRFPAATVSSLKMVGPFPFGQRPGLLSSLRTRAMPHKYGTVTFSSPRRPHRRWTSQEHPHEPPLSSVLSRPRCPFRRL